MLIFLYRLYGTVMFRSRSLPGQVTMAQHRTAGGEPAVRDGWTVPWVQSEVFFGCNKQDSSFPPIFSQFLLALLKAQLANKQAATRGLTCLVTAQRHPKPAKMPDDFNGSVTERLRTDAGLQRTRAARIDTTNTKNPDKMYMPRITKVRTIL